MTRAKHRPPSRPPRFTWLLKPTAAVAALLPAASLAMLWQGTWEQTAPHTAAAPTAVERTREPTGHGGPIAPPTFADPHVWTPAKGPVIANGQRLPAVTAAPVKTTATPKPKPENLNPPAPVQVSSAAPEPAPVQPATGLLALVNADRATAGCPPVTIAANLTSQAQTHSNAQAAADSMFHSSSVDGYDSWGENVAAGQETEAEVEAAWMASEGHRANILSCEFTVMGFASAVSASGTRYWTEQFAA